eukprot:11741473-Karenia_brevis.AAC.1
MMYATKQERIMALPVAAPLPPLTTVAAQKPHATMAQLNQPLNKSPAAPIPCAASWSGCFVTRAMQPN